MNMLGEYPSSTEHKPRSPGVPALERMEQIKYAVMEVGGHISVISK